MKNKFCLMLLLTLNLIFLNSCKTTEIVKTQQLTFTPPIMGWASWNNYHVNISEDIIKAQADAMVNSGLVNYGYKFINIDDGFFGGRDENGKLLSHPTRFPSGMKKMAEYIHSKGLKAGIYSDAGINTCASHYDKDSIGVGMGLYGHDEHDLRLFLEEWNYDFIKVDWCGGNWLGLDEEARYTEIAELARRIKPSVIYNVCRWEFPGKWVTKVANSWRISTDLRANFNSVLKTIDANADLWRYASPGRYNDMDMLQVGRGMTYDQDKAHFSMWCLMHSPLMLGNDLTKLSPGILEIVTNEELIAINQSPYVYQARRLKKLNELEVWGRPLVSTMSGHVVVAFLNRSQTAQNISVNINEIGLDASQGYTTRDLWSKKETPVSNKEIVSRVVPAQGIVVLKVSGKAMPFNVFQFKDGGR